MEKIIKLLAIVTLLQLVFGFHVTISWCDKDQLDALMELKAAINYPNGNALPNWIIHDHAGRPTGSDWDEVYCGESGQVEQINLFEVREDAELKGDWYVNASLFLPFQQLNWLELSNNAITGWTHHLAQLPSLQSLSVAGNKLKGIIDVHDLKNLQSLDLSDNSIDGFKRSHEKQFSHGKLEELILKNIAFSDANTFMDSLSAFPSLKSLTLRGTNFTGLIESSGLLYQLKNIQVLDIAETYLQGRVPLWLSNLTSLQDLDLSQNNLHGELPFFLANLTHLKFIDLSSNQFVGNVANSPLTKLISLRIISLSNNKFEIPQTFISFNNHSSLKVLRVDGNNLIPDTAIHRPFVPKFQLSHFSMSNCNLVGKLPYFLLSQYHLIYLELSHNRIDDSFPGWIVRNNTLLEVVTLQNNSLSSLHLPSHFHHHLTALDVSYNYINSLPTSLTIFSALRILHLNNNNISGMIPSTFFPSSLVAIDLSNNHLEGQIPTNICNLNFLNLAHNSMAGFPPPCIYDSNLSYVFLNNNKLNGSLLPISKENVLLVILDLGSNHLSGVIPEWIGNIRNLSGLILSDNHFMSYIPTQICSLDQLRILDLSNNNLSGEIPNCLGRITFQSTEETSFYVGASLMVPTLEDDPFFNDDYVDFEQGDSIYSIKSMEMELDITTKLHTYAYVGEDLETMSTIDLSCNKLSGHIPREIGWMTGVRGLNLSHNEFIGPIPSTLSKLIRIESLDISYNNLNGSIPFELTQLNTLEVFSVAYNNLSGKIPDGKAQFETFDGSSYQGNPYLCGPPLPNNCFISSPNGRDLEDVNGSFDLYVFYICFSVSSLIFFVGTLIVLYVNPHWRRMWFYYVEMWISFVHFIIVVSTGKAMKACIGVMSRIIHCR